ncbi:SMI1/KNR4 family protein [Streptomyces sp. NPDC005438]|uniref:SMI1/KNR4 family protein n=1 Tax=Streptomyces sp. NPDC005438 TaxID=3156880 RepID=UPI0033BA72E8
MSAPDPDLDRLFPPADRPDPPASAEQVTRAQRELGVAFPSDYREFLTRVGSFNGHLNGALADGRAYQRFFDVAEVVSCSQDYDDLPWACAVVGDTGASWKYVLRETPDGGGEFVLYDFGSDDVLETYGDTFATLLRAVTADL